MLSSVSASASSACPSGRRLHLHCRFFFLWQISLFVWFLQYCVPHVFPAVHGARPSSQVNSPLVGADGDRHRRSFRGDASSSAPSSVSPSVDRRRHHRDFRWTAALNRTTGVTSSREMSSIVVPSSSRAGHVSDFARQTLGSYPSFLGRPSLTLGMCRSVPTNGVDDGANDGIVDLRLSLLGWSLLTFGKPKSIGKKASVPFRDRCVVWAMEIPIVGGLLTHAHDDEDRGFIRLTWLSPSVLGESSAPSARETATLVTEIGGSYRPSLAGSDLPIPAWRSSLYHNTQRLVHAYVMWRFHGHVATEYERHVRDAAEESDDGSAGE